MSSAAVWANEWTNKLTQNPPQPPHTHTHTNRKWTIENLREQNHANIAADPRGSPDRSHEIPLRVAIRCADVPANEPPRLIYILSARSAFSTHVSHRMRATSSNTRPQKEWTPKRDIIDQDCGHWQQFRKFATCLRFFLLLLLVCCAGACYHRFVRLNVGRIVFRARIFSSHPLRTSKRLATTTIATPRTLTEPPPRRRRRPPHSPATSPVCIILPAKSCAVRSNIAQRGAFCAVCVYPPRARALD